MSQIITKELKNRDPSGMVIVVAGASHLIYGSRGTGVPARVSKKTSKKDQVVVLLDPERQSIRREGEIPVADFLWYSAAKPCSRNCFDRAEIARVMNAAGRRPEALPQVFNQTSQCQSCIRKNKTVAKTFEYCGSIIFCIIFLILLFYGTIAGSSERSCFS